MNLWAVWVGVSYVMAVWMFFNVLSSLSEIEELGKSKLRWFLLSLLGIVPYLGSIIALAYYVMVRVNFPAPPPQPTSGTYRPMPRNPYLAQQEAARIEYNNRRPVGSPPWMLGSSGPPPPWAR